MLTALTPYETEWTSQVVGLFVTANVNHNHGKAKQSHLVAK